MIHPVLLDPNNVCFSFPFPAAETGGDEYGEDEDSD